MTDAATPVPALYASVDVHRPSHTVTVEGPQTLRTHLRARVVDTNGFAFFPTNTVINAQIRHRMQGVFRNRTGTSVFPMYRLWMEMDSAGYTLVSSFSCVTADRDTYVWRKPPS